MIAALFVETDGVYFDLEGVDPWDVRRDARRYAGPDAVVAHPPCNRWSMLAKPNESRWGYMVGADDGMFASALHSVRTYGGVLEHPAFSLAWPAFGLHRPVRGCWSESLHDGGFVTEISQSVYGCEARKLTWLYAVGIDPVALDWRDAQGSRVIGGNMRYERSAGTAATKLRGAEASRTPIRLRDELVSLARSVAR